jgi:nucleoside-diphosphate-sugar epimerase
MLKVLITGGDGNLASIIRRNLEELFNITNVNHHEFDMTCAENMKKYLTDKQFDVVIHTAIQGGRRTMVDESEIFYKNVLMFENLLLFADRFKMIINIDSGAIYDRNTDIMFRREYEINTVPVDYYGLSKYVIHKRSAEYDNIYHLRVFNIFHAREEPDRFIAKCFMAERRKKPIFIQEDKYFDFVYECDFVEIVNSYIASVESDNKMPKTINVCYKEKCKLSDVAKMIIKDPHLIHVGEYVSSRNYMGDSQLLYSLGIPIYGLENGLAMYKEELARNKTPPV